VQYNPDVRAYLSALARRQSANTPVNGLLSGTTDAAFTCLGEPGCDVTPLCIARNRCDSWRCPTCNPRMAREVEQILLAGLFATESNSHVSIGSIDHSLEELQDACKRLRRPLRGALSDYATVIGFNPETWHLHIHLMLLDAPWVPIQAIAKHCRIIGLGKPRINRIEPTPEDAKRVASYMRENLLTLQHAPPAPGTRLRPFNKSRTWPRS